MRKFAIWAGAILALYAVLGFLVAPPIVRHQLEQVLAEQLGRKVTIEQVRINPFALSAAIRNFSLKENDGSTDALTFAELGVNVTLSSLVRLGVVVESVQLAKPYVRLVRYDDGTYNFQDIVDKFANSPAEPATAQPAAQTPAASPRFAIYNVVLRDGRIDFDDQPQKTKHAITDLQIGLPFVSSLPRQVDIVVAPRLSANVNGTPFEIVGEAKPFKDTHEATVHLDIDDLELGKYLAYSPVPLRVRVPSAKLDTRLALSFATARSGALQTLALSGTASLRQLNVQYADGAPLAALDRLSIELDSVDFLQTRAAIRKVLVEAPKVDIAREEDGRFKLLGVVPPAKPAAPSSSESPLKFSVAQFALSDGVVRFVDHSAGKPVRLALSKVSVNVDDLGNGGQTAKVRLGAGVGAKGRLGYDGSLQLVPVRTEGKLELVGLRIDAFAPYIEQLLNVVVTSGAFSTRGRLSLALPEGSPMQFAYRADAGVSGFASLDQATSQDLLNWKSLAVTGIDFQLAPLKLGIGEITLSDLYSRLIVNPDGTLNWRGVPKQSDAAAAQATRAAEPRTGPAPDIHLGKIVLHGGRINFTDYFIRPNYTVMLTGVEASMTEMTPEKPSELSLAGRIHQTSPVEVAGRVNVLSPELVLDMKASARDIQLSEMSAYSAKYAGYGIDKGTLSVRLSYLVHERKLEAQNNIYLDQLTFGDKVDSPTATKLPVQFAVALLKDKNGVIDVNLPVAGTLDDPQFSVGGVIVQVFLNLIEKAVTSPFAAIASAFGGGEELAFVEFAPGSAVVDGAQETKLATLAKALNERPGLRLEVSGRIDTDADRQVLKRAAVDRQVQAMKASDIENGTVAAAGGAEPKVAPDEYGKYLAAAYRAADFERPFDAKGALQELPAAEMERLMLANAKVSDEDLRLLAQTRAQAAKDWLVGPGKIAPERVLIAPAASTEGKASRVDFVLK
ncbi:MAG TPA: DUF748 domain-containing protein [Burkholderiales bacterium]|nr:DUF748 domain-containing protein [Burkholderiales bacterium]